MDYVADDLEGEAPCEFCGELYPLVLLIEHQSIHLTAGDDYSYLDDLVNQEEIAQNVIAEDIGLTSTPEIIFEQKQQSAVNNQTNTIDKSANTTQNSGSSETKISDEKAKSEQKRNTSESSDQIMYSEFCKRRRILSRSRTSEKSDEDCLMDEPNDEEFDDISFISESKALDENATTEQKQSFLFNKALKDIKKFPEQKGKEFITEKGEKLLVYGDEIDPDKDLENEKPAYKIPDNPLLNSVIKNEDVEDINNLSDDDCNESLEEFWKRARDFLKRNRVRNES